jgi:hypothetical protein
MKINFKLSLFILALIFLASFVSAVEVRLTNPVDKVVVQEGTEVFLGNLAQGEAFELLASIKQDTDTARLYQWNRFEVFNIAEGIKVERIKASNELFGLSISISPKQLPKKYSLDLRAVELIERSRQIPFKVSFNVITPKEALLITPPKQEQEMFITQTLPLSFALKNTTIGKTPVMIFTDLPSGWATSTITEPIGTKEITATINLTPLAYGNKHFKVYVKALTTNEIIAEYDFDLTIKPTIASKFLATGRAFPIMNPTLYFFYYLFGIFSQ